MQLIDGLLVLGGLWVAWVAWPYLKRPVSRVSLFSAIFELSLESWVRAGLNGFDAYVYHPASETVLKISKRMPYNSRKQKVALYVTKLRLPQDSQAGRRYRYRRIRGEECAVVWFWQLPPVRRACRVEKVRCLGSMKRVFHAVHRMMSDEEAVRKNDQILLWSRAGRSWVQGSQFGVFDD